MATVAYSYIRFSSVAQEKGDSLRRQTTGSEEYARKKGYILDTSLRLTDLGVSAFRGNNVREGALGAFLEAIKQGRVHPGSVLIVESLDRLTRDQIFEAQGLFMDILRAGVSIATLTPEREYSREHINEHGVLGLLEALFIFSRAHEESKTKSERLTKAWQAKRSRLEREVLTAKCPSWCKVKRDRSGFDLVPDKAAAVRQIFEWASEGLGVNSITRKLNKSHAPIGRTDSWHRSYVMKILKNRAVIGEYQPHVGHAGPTRRPTGKPISNYYPVLIKESLFYSVQAALKSRRKMAGRAGRSVANLFTGLVRDARDKAPMNIIDKGEGRQLVSSKALRGVPGSRYLAFSYDLFEDAFLIFIRDLSPADVLPPKPILDRDEQSVLTGQIAELDYKIDRTRRKVAENPDVDALLDLLTDLGRQKKRLENDLEKAKARASESEADTLDDLRSILEIMGAAEGEQLELLRSRLRQRIRFLISAIWTLVWEEKARWHPVDRDRETTFRFVKVQVNFTNGTHQLFYLENKLRMVIGLPNKAEDLGPDYEHHHKDHDLSDYNGRIDLPLGEVEDDVDAVRMWLIETAIRAMRETSDDKRLVGVRAPTMKERTALALIASFNGQEIHWRTVGSLVRRGWATQNEDMLELTKEGRSILAKYGH